jgi:oleate hydratase
VLPGERMIESKYPCTFDLFSAIPTLNGSKTVTQEITLQASSKSRLFRSGHRETAPSFGLRERDILALERLALEPKAMPGGTSIAEQLDPG